MRAELESIVGAAALDERPVRETIRGNLPVPSHRAAPRRGAALFPAVVITRKSLQTTNRRLRDQVAAGQNPAALATLVNG